MEGININNTEMAIAGYLIDKFPDTDVHFKSGNLFSLQDTPGEIILIGERSGFENWKDDIPVFIVTVVIHDGSNEFEHFYKAFRYIMSYEDVEMGS